MSFKTVEKKKYLECGKIVNTHGVKGAVKIESYADTPESLARIRTLYFKKGAEYEEIKVLKTSIQKNMVLAALEGVESVEAAVALKNKIVYADRESFRLRRGDFFIADILGMDVVDDENGTVYGTLHDVLAPAGQQVYVVKKADGKTFMVPCVPEFIKKVSFGEDCDAGIYVKLIEGMDEI